VSTGDEQYTDGNVQEGDAVQVILRGTVVRRYGDFVDVEFDDLGGGTRTFRVDEVWRKKTAGMLAPSSPVKHLPRDDTGRFGFPTESAD
jgi:hypothetical protein